MPVAASPRRQLVSELLLLFIALLWGSTNVITQDAIQEITPFYLVALRFSIAAVIVAPFALARRRAPSALPWTRGTWVAGALIGASIFSATAFFTIALLTTTIAKSAFIAGTSVVVTPLAVAVIYRRRTEGNVWVGVLLALAGMSILLLRGEQGVVIGDLFSFLCAVSLAAMILMVDRFSQVHPVMPLALIEFVTASALGAAAVFISGEAWVIPEVHQWGAIAYLGVLCTAVPFLVQTAVQRFTTETRAALISLSESVFATMLGVVVVGEILGVGQLFGCAMVLGGMLSAQAPQLGVVVRDWTQSLRARRATRSRPS